MTHPNAELVRQTYEAFQKEDLDTLKGLVSPAVKWHEARNSETIQCAEAVHQRFGMGRIEADIHIHSMLSDDENVVSRIRARMRKPDGDQVSYPVLKVVYGECGMITEHWAFI